MCFIDREMYILTVTIFLFLYSTLLNDSYTLIPNRVQLCTQSL